MLDADRFKVVCQNVYFPINGYSMSDFIIANGGLISILENATDLELKACNIDSRDAAEGIAICERNVDAAIENLSPFLEPTLSNIEGLLFAVSGKTSSTDYL